MGQSKEKYIVVKDVYCESLYIHDSEADALREIEQLLDEEGNDVDSYYLFKGVELKLDKEVKVRVVVK